jgi:hypothetical protein
VTWQDELQALDERLASGTISAEEYRRSRDDLLAKSAWQPGGDQHQPQQQQPPQPYGQQPQQQPPQQQWTARPPGDGADSTQFLPRITDDTPPPGERTQIVGSGSADRTQAVSGNNERTQVVPGLTGPHPQQQPQQQWPGGPPPNTPSGGWPAQPQRPQQPPRQGGDYGNTAPPWADGFDPAPRQPEAWLRQGPDSFESGSRSRRGRTIGIVVAVIVVVALGVGAGLYFTHDSKSTPQASGPTSSAAPTSTTKPLPTPPPTKAAPASTAGALITAPGTPRNGGGQLDLATLSSRNLLAQPMLTALGNAGMTDGLLNTSTYSNGDIIGLYAFTVGSQDQAETVALAYGDLQRNGGVPDDRADSLQGVSVFSTPSETTNAIFRAVYVLYNRVIVVETFGPGYDATRQVFNQVLQQQLAQSPPTVRTS